MGAIIAILRCVQLTNSTANKINKLRGSGIGPTTSRGRTAVKPLTAISAVAATAFVLLAVAVDRGATRDSDRRARRIVGPRRSRKITNIASLASNIASPHIHPLAAAGLGLVMYRRCGRNALAIPLASLGATVVDRGVRYLIHQSRPPKATHHPGLDKFAFPSGHTCAATAIGLAFAAQRPGNTPAQNRLAVSAAIAASLGIAWTRLYLDEHWIDDVLGGWLAGIAVGAASVAATRALAPNRKISSRLSAP